MSQSDEAKQPHAAQTARPIAVIGAGSIGTGMAVVFAMAGRKVRIYDQSREQRDTVRGRIADIVRDLQEFELIGQNEHSVLANVHVVDRLADALENVEFVQECAPEQLELKSKLFTDLARLAPQDESRRCCPCRSPQ